MGEGGNSAPGSIADIKKLGHFRTMKRVLVFSLVLLAACAKHPSSITRQESDAVAVKMFENYLLRSTTSAQVFKAVKVLTVKNVSGEGWHYRWVCRSQPESGVGVFVGIDGTADYDEAPDCGSKGDVR